MNKPGILVAMLLFAATTSCTKVSNTISEMVLSCGEDAEENRHYFQLLSPTGAGLSNKDLIAQTPSFAKISVTSKGCIDKALLESSAIIVSSSSPDRIWGKVVKSADLPVFGQIKLVEKTDVQPTLDCSMRYSKTTLNPVIRVADEDREAFAAEIKLLKGEEILVQERTLSFTNPVIVDEGHYEVVAEYKNLYRSSMDLVSRSIKCPVTVDRTAPIVSSNLATNVSEGLFRIGPGQTIDLKAQDLNPKSLKACLRLMEESAGCKDAAKTQTGVDQLTLIAPASGKWCLEVIADDLAGNESALSTFCFVSYQEELVNTIKLQVQNARIQAATDRVAAIAQLVRAKRTFESLKTSEE